MQGEWIHPAPASLVELTQTSLTPLLHEDEEVVQEFLPLGIAVQFVELEGKQTKVRARIHRETENRGTLASSRVVLALQG